MDRLDKIAFQISDEVFADAFFNELLTPTAFTAKFGNLAGAPAPSFFAELGSLLSEDVYAQAQSDSARIFYDDYKREAATATFLNDIIGPADREVDEFLVYSRSVAHRSLGALNRLSEMALEIERFVTDTKANDRSASILDWYNNDAASLAGLGFDVSSLSDPSGYSVDDLFNFRNTSNPLIAEKLAQAFSPNATPEVDKRPTSSIDFGNEAEIIYLSQLIEATKADEIGTNEFYYGTEDERRDVYAPLNKWSNLLRQFESSVDHWTYAFATGAVKNTESGRANLLRSDGDSFSGEDIGKLLLAGGDEVDKATGELSEFTKIIDPETGQQILVRDFANKYLSELPSYNDLLDAANALQTLFSDKIGVDISPILFGQLHNAEQFYEGATFGDIDAKYFDIPALIQATAVLTEESGGSARRFAYADFQNFIIGKLISPNPELPEDQRPPAEIPDAFLLQPERSTALINTRGEVLKNTSDVQLTTEFVQWGDLSKLRQFTIEAFITASDDSRPFYKLQIAQLDTDLAMLQSAMERKIEKSRSDSADIDASLAILQNLFAEDDLRAGNLIDAASQYTGARVDVPILRGPLAVKPEAILNLQWNAAELDQTPPFDLNSIFGAGTDDASWRNASAQSYFEAILPAIAEATGNGFTLPAPATVADFEAALRSRNGGDAIADGTSALADALIAYQAKLTAYEAARLDFLRTNPFSRPDDWLGYDQENGFTQEATAAYGAVEGALTSLGVSKTILEKGISVPAITDGGPAVPFRAIPNVETVLAEVEFAALQSDATVTPLRATYADFIGIDARMPSEWRGGDLAGVKEKVKAGLDALTLPGGGELTFSDTWIDGVSLKILEYQSTVLAYEKSLVSGLLGALPSVDILADAGPHRAEIDLARAELLTAIETETGGYDQAPAATKLLGDFYGLLPTADNLETGLVANQSVRGWIESEPYIPYIADSSDGPVIVYFDPRSSALSKIDADFSAVNGTIPDALAPRDLAEIEAFADNFRNQEAETKIGAVSDGVFAAARLQLLPEKPVVFESSGISRTLESGLSSSELGFSLVGLGQTLLDLSNGQDPLIAAAGYANGVSELSNAIAEFIDANYESATSTGKFVALKALSSVASAVAVSASIGTYKAQRAELIADGEPTAALDTRFALEVTGSALTILDSTLSALVVAGKITGLAARAVPLVGATAGLLLTINPDRQTSYQLQADAIAAAEARTDFSSELAADLLEDQSTRLKAK